MRTKIIIALVATAVTMSSCDWFSSSPSASAAFQGRWRLDTVVTGKDSSDLTWLLLSMLLPNDTTGEQNLEVTFLKDSVVTTYSQGVADTSAFSVNEKLNTIAVQFKNDPDTLQYRFHSPDKLSLIYPDSTVLELRKM